MELLWRLGISNWRKEGSRESLEPFPEPKGAPGELERDWGPGMEGQDTGNGIPTGKREIGMGFWEGIPGWEGEERLEWNSQRIPGSLGVSKERLEGLGAAWDSLEWDDPSGPFPPKEFHDKSRKLRAVPSPAAAARDDVWDGISGRNS
ncbi:hypothetical protein HGM15179_020370 [Zosterops borbonicus]|uniref:Uncharacterized protein n=1 Tax=Zosterops borbonicus TaxID=364589 RepID=A0A8K1D724_9PASS|nr:hypothetical protein HGM15179_020370 [Zosterops borbonicus]